MMLTIWLPLAALAVLILLAWILTGKDPNPNHEFIVGMLEKLQEGEHGDDGNRAG